MHGHEDKASHYIALLDTARVNGSWSELPELVRKVNKHAPQRTALIQTATLELQIVNGPTRPLTSAGQDGTAVSTLISTLSTQSDNQNEDCIQGRASLLWARWCGIDLPSSTHEQLRNEDIEVMLLSSKNTSVWTKICLVKRAYILGTTQIQNGQILQGWSTFTTAVDVMQTDQALILSTPQLAYWSEQLLGQLVMIQSVDVDNKTAHEATRLEAFGYWSAITTKTKEVPASTYKNNSMFHLARNRVWKKYYECLSKSLRDGANSKSNSAQIRLQQSTDLRKVERAYENELLRSHKFPKATESNREIEQWVEQVIQNWQVICGPQWRDEELGEGGSNAVTRNVLDMLYRAATKTFHSLLILRRLFQVHKSLTEFDLAYKALDTYIELVEQARIRASKSDKPEPGRESNETILYTMAEGIEGLCAFGRQEEARKSYELCLKLEDWLERLGLGPSDHNNETQEPNGHVIHPASETSISPFVLQSVYRAIGIGKAHWARWTPFSEHRSGLQEEALTNLKIACSQQSTEDTQVETLYAIGLLLAETRNVTQAIVYVKQGLARGTSSLRQDSDWSFERKSIALWHLLALLLSARDEYENATTSCFAAFEQFPSSAVLLGTKGKETSTDIQPEKDTNVSDRGLVSEMQCNELQRIIEIRITDLALTELSDGPEEAVNSSDDLLALFSQIFSHLQAQFDGPAIPRNLEPPKSSAGTLRSTKGSIFSRRKHLSTTESIPEKTYGASIMTNTTRPSTRATQAPTIQITDEEGKSPKPKHHLFRLSLDRAREGKTSFESTSRKHVTNRNSRSSQHTTDQADGRSMQQDQNTIPPNTSRAGTITETPNPIIPLDHENSVQSRQPLPDIDHSLGSQNHMPIPAAHEKQPLQQDVRLPTLNSFTNATSPPPRFSKTATEKHAFTILVKIWLVIATLYRRASMYNDSKEACEEASKIAAKIEALVGAVDHSARIFADPGWGGAGKSVDEIWADVYCEKAELELAVYNRRTQEGQETRNDGLRTVVDYYEQCLMYFPNHRRGIVGLSNLLLDYYEKKIDLAKKVDDGKPNVIDIEHTILVERPSLDRQFSAEISTGPPIFARGTSYSSDPTSRTEDDLRKTPENLNRIAARDRAYGLLSTLTKLGSGWDNSEAWFALARAHELGGELEKAKSILWWCIELENTKPIRHWRNLGYSI